MMQDENLTPYVEGALGRWYPVTKAGVARDFWTNDPHRKIVHQQFSAGVV
jgi:multiple sugar transport system substrate-binding protein